MLYDYNRDYRNKLSKKPSLYNVDDYVLIRDTRNQPNENSKLKPCYKGPYRISKVLGNNRYVVKDIPGFNITQKPLDTILSSDKLKTWIKLFSSNTLSTSRDVTTAIRLKNYFRVATIRP